MARSGSAPFLETRREAGELALFFQAAQAFGIAGLG
jgi:hypothetical protein